jgi:P-type Ca2+ transporter type 2C
LRAPSRNLRLFSRAARLNSGRASLKQARAELILQEAWHSLPPGEALARLRSRSEGLSQSEVAERLERFGPNALPEPRATPLWLVILRQFRNPFIYVLAFAVAVSLLLGAWSDAAFILAVILLNTGIGAVQEWRAETSAAALRRSLRISPTVVRAGRRREVDYAHLVPGDIVILQAGAAVAADLRLVSSHDLRIDEALLTGEAQASRKDAEAALEQDAIVGDRTTMAHAGTMILSGRGVGVVCATGEQTELGKIAKALAAPGGEPPLLLRLRTFSNRVALATIALVILLGAGQALRGDPPGEILLFTIALAVSAIPEGLPMAITIALAAASTRMSRRGVIVRLLPAVEALGSCTLIATDKTGTLTVNRLTVKRIILPDGAACGVAGEGLELEGALVLTDQRRGEHERATARLARAAALTNEADLRIGDGTVKARGDAVDIAFLVLAAKLGLSHAQLIKAHPQLAELPYETLHTHSASLNGDEEDGALLSVKGAPEIVLPMCRGIGRKRLDEAMWKLASEGYRVIAVAQRKRARHGELSADDLHDLELLGLAGLIDPLRNEAPAAVARARKAGVDVRMITGDHPETALATARQLDPSWRPDKALTGRQLAQLQGEARERAIREAAVFARVEPAQKTLIVRELQRQGHFVAVTGDGVNDAPALKAAHVGVAMGAGGTDVARAAADLVITDDDFASIVAGIEEGRVAYANIRKIVWFLISTGIAEVLLFTLALIAGLKLPLTAVQILWFNLVTEGVQALTLGFEGKEPDTMCRKPRGPAEPVFDRQMIEQCLVIGLYVGAAAIALFAWLHLSAGYDEQAARNLTLLFLVSYSNLHVLNCRSETRSALAIPFNANPFLFAGVIGAQAVHIAAMHIPLMQEALGLSPVRLVEWVGVFALAATVLVVGELYKAVRARPRAVRSINASVAPATH